MGVYAVVYRYKVMRVMMGARDGEETKERGEGEGDWWGTGSETRSVGESVVSGREVGSEGWKKGVTRGDPGSGVMAFGNRTGIGEWAKSNTTSRLSF